MDEDANVVLIQRLVILAFSAFIAAVISRVGWKRGFYRLPVEVVPSHENGMPSLNVRNVLAMFSIFLFVELIIAPFGYTIWQAYLAGVSPFSSELAIDQNARTWMSFWGIVLTSVALVSYLFSLQPTVRHQILGPNARGNAIFKNVGYYLFGALAWFVVYPLLIAFGQLLEIGIEFLQLGPHVDQIAVKHLRGILDSPELFWLMSAVVVFVVPFMEELLFRGCLQAWLNKYLGRGKSIVFTSLIFAVFHFSSEQKIGNIELLGSLFLLSCYLGFLKEKKQSLWASIGLHTTFNGISVLMLYVS